MGFGYFAQIFSAPSKLTNIKHFGTTKASIVKKSLKIPFLILKATQSDYGHILNFLARAYFPEEPICQGIGLSRRCHPVLEDEILKILTQGLSLGARCKTTGKLAGVSLCGASYSWDREVEVKTIRNIGCKKTRQLFECLAFVHDAPKIYERYSTDKILEIKAVATDPSFRRQGLAHLLIQEALYRGREKFEFIRMNSSDSSVSRICENLGMFKVHEIPFDKFVDKEQKPILNVKPPNTHLQVYLDAKK